MTDNDTISLLKECDSGTKMAVSSIDEILESVKSSELKQLLRESKKHHADLGNELHRLLAEIGSEEKEPSPTAKGMSWCKTNMKMMMDKSDATIADLITDGCDMGIKSLHRYKNQYKTADTQAQDLCLRLISIEEALRRDLSCYL
ncbi:MAG: hypothetical protein PHG16_09595 [Lachnospiraceae bacterium]|nr:hypothetical protein [Lachnospiraceae bacterium]